MYMLFDWCGQCRVLKIVALVKEILNIIRIVVPIGLIAMTSLDVFKKVLNPEDKEGQKKILTRVIVAVLVFLTPAIINIFLSVIDKVSNHNASAAWNNSCWTNATKSCSD